MESKKHEEATDADKKRSEYKLNINKEELGRAIGEVQTGKFTKRLTLYANKATIPIRYVDIITPLFSMAGAATGLIEEQMAKDYPELYQYATVGFGETHPSKHAQAVKDMDISSLDPHTVTQAKAEAEHQSGKTLAIYNERIAAIIRYFMLTTPRYSISKELGGLLEKRISNIHPEIWDKFEV